ncbi:MAG: T9SS type A sorting domain-containing protein [Ignavibacteriales bacterium]|nr:T9SS type A sorting domain-containing protein [Ignavibacteriales bacterium]
MSKQALLYSFLFILFLNFSIISQDRTDKKVYLDRIPDSEITIPKLVNSPLKSLSFNSTAFGVIRDSYGTFPVGPCKFQLNDPLSLISLDSNSTYVAGADFAGDGKWYGCDYYGNLLLSIDTTLGILDTIGPMVPYGSGVWLSMTYDFSTGNMFALSSYSSFSILYTVNLLNGNLTLVDTVAGLGYLVGLSADNNGQLYAVDILVDAFYKIDKTTAVATLIGNTGYSGNGGQDIEFDPETNILYYAASPASGNYGDLMVIDVVTGEAYMLGEFPDHNRVTGFGIPGTRSTILSLGYPAVLVPSDDSTGVDPNGLTLQWTNAGLTTYNELYLSKDPILVATCDPSARVLNGYPGTAYTNYYIPYTLDEGRNYYWRVVEYNPGLTARTNGQIWNFTTTDKCIWKDDFESGLNNWLIDGSTPPIDSSGWTLWEFDSYPTGSSFGLQMPSTAGGYIVAANAEFSGDTMRTILELGSGIDFSDYYNVSLRYDSDFQRYSPYLDSGIVEISPNGGVDWYVIKTYNNDTPYDSSIIDISGYADSYPDVKVRFTYVGRLNQSWYWALDNVAFYGINKNPTKIEDITQIPEQFLLEQNYPNPFNPSTTIRFSLPVDSKVKLEVFNLLGEKIDELVNSNLHAGQYEIKFNASNLSSGVYFYRIQTLCTDGSKYSNFKKMLLLK